MACRQQAGAREVQPGAFNQGGSRSGGLQWLLEDPLLNPSPGNAERIAKGYDPAGDAGAWRLTGRLKRLMNVRRRNCLLEVRLICR